jgi:hypothetical protein
MTPPIRCETGQEAKTYKRLCLMRIACLTASLLSGMPSFASTDDAPASPLEIIAQFDPIRHETRIQGEILADACMTLQLTGEWKLSGSDDSRSSLATASGAEIEVRVRPAAELKSVPHGDLADREAAALQRTYEEIVGKPVQAVLHEPTGYKGVSRWSATWFDGNFANAGHSFEIETFIVEASGGSALELTFTNKGSPDAHEAAVARMLSSLRVINGSDCQYRLPAGW